MIDIIAAVALWVGLLAVPLFFTHGDRYKYIFPAEWYDEVPTNYWPFDTNNVPSPVGLCLGLLAVAVGQVFVLIYFYLKRQGYLSELRCIQNCGAPKYDWSEGIRTHLAQPEGFILLGAYLIGTWMFGLMSPSYYSFNGGIDIVHVITQLLIQDLIQTIVHWAEHKIHPVVYQLSHKPHHRFLNPRLFDAFNGSFFDTFFMILCPLFIVSKLVDANVWSYMAFGSIYANWLVLIHSEYHQDWDFIFQFIGFGTAADHHIHHKLFIFNYGHLFSFWDRLLGTYKEPESCEKFVKY